MATSNSNNFTDIENIQTSSKNLDLNAKQSRKDHIKKPVCIIVMGMAGSGKTTFVQKLSSKFHLNKTPHYVVNLDPAVRDVPFLTYIDIRDTVNYKEVMKQYKLGPNGGIVTSLNLFCTKFDDVMKLLESKKDLDYIIFDTPGQIEVFNWSASGSIIAGTLASVFPTVIVYVMDIVRSTQPQTFMSNMLYACSILYKYKLPFMIAMNKTDIVECDYALKWMQDFEEFGTALESETSYGSTLSRSLSLALEEFYKNIKSCGISSLTGKGMEELILKLEECSVEYEEYREEFEKLRDSKKSSTLKRSDEMLRKMNEDLRDEFGSLRKRIHDETEIFLSPGVGSSDEAEEVDEDDTEEKNEGESFRSFLSQHKHITAQKVVEKEKLQDQMRETNG